MEKESQNFPPKSTKGAKKNTSGSGASDVLTEIPESWQDFIGKKVECADHPGNFWQLDADQMYKEMKAALASGTRLKHWWKDWDDFYQCQIKFAGVPCEICGYKACASMLTEAVRNAGVPSVLEAESLDTFEKPSDWIESRYESAKEDIRDFSEVGRGLLLITGTPGSGKDHLAVAAMKLRGNPDGMRWITQAEMILKIRDTYGKGDTLAFLNKLAQAKFLVISDVGLSYGGSDELVHLHYVMDKRYSEFLPTVITTNLPVNSDGANLSLHKYLGDRLYDRMSQMIRQRIDMTTNDGRKKWLPKYYAKKRNR